MQGILIYALLAIEKQQYILAAALYSALLNFKHIYLYVLKK